MHPEFIQAVFDPSLRAQVVSRWDLVYTSFEEHLDQAPHVRAASGISWFGDELAIVQDDTSFIALVDPRTRQIRTIVLPADASGARQFDRLRGNKAKKPDLESCFVVGDTLVALGSGSHPQRERVVQITRRGDAFDVRVAQATSLYRAMRERTDFSGSELNIEGAVCLGERVRLFQRGNGAPVGDRRAQNATLDLDLPALQRYLADPSTVVPDFFDVKRYDLGECASVPLTFTDATLADDRTIWFVASAEASPNTFDDGEVMGTMIGQIDTSGAVRYGVLYTESGAACRDKVEGLVFDRDHPLKAFAVIDADDPARPAQLLELAITPRAR